MRLDKYISTLGRSTRSKTRKAMKKYNGCIVNEQVINDPSFELNEGDELDRFGQEVIVRTKVTIALHKPASYISSDVDEAHYESYRNLLGDFPYTKMIHIAWRLDVDTEWLLIATSDGELNRIISAPKRKLPKVYTVHIEHSISKSDIKKLEAGIELEDGYVTLPCSVQRLETPDTPFAITMTLHEGKYHQVKRMLQAVNNQVIYLRRDSIGDRSLDNLSLAKGEWCYIDGV